MLERYNQEIGYIVKRADAIKDLLKGYFKTDSIDKLTENKYEKVLIEAEKIIKSLRENVLFEKEYGEETPALSIKSDTLQSLNPVKLLYDEDGLLHIETPPLMNRKKTNAAYIKIAAKEALVNVIGDDIPEIELPATFVIVQHSQKLLSGKVPDSDNIETRGTTNIICEFLMISDNPKNISFFTTAVPDTKEYTDFCLCPNKMLLKYIKKVQKMGAKSAQ